ncbi:MAG: hypothetical protein ACTSPQ_11625 [Candidatus Helarchaeota archaeon]
MKVYEIGLLRNEELLLERRYYKKILKNVDECDIDNEREILFRIIKENAEYKNDLKSFEILRYHVSSLAKKNGEKSRFISYLISDKKIDLGQKKSLLKKVLDEFFNYYPPPKCYNVHTSVFNGFTEKIEKIVEDFILEPSERLTKVFKSD